MMLEIVQNGKHFKLIMSAGPKVTQNEFTLGEECELDTVMGKVKVGGSPSTHPLLPEFSLNPDPAFPVSHHSHHRCVITGAIIGWERHKVSTQGSFFSFLGAGR